MKINKRLAIIVSLIVVVGVAIGVAVTLSNAHAAYARDATARNSAILDDLVLSGVKELARATESQCNRSNIFSPATCEEVEVRVYSVDDSQQYQQTMTTRLTSNGWVSDIEGEPAKFFSTNTVVTSPHIAQASATRNANNNDSGASIPQNLLLAIEKEVPTNDNGYFKGTRIKYSEETRIKLDDATKNGNLVIMTTYHQYEAWL